MIKMLAVAIWASVIAALAGSFAAHWQAAKASPQKADAIEHVYEYRKTKVINVPVIADGALLGYVLVQFLYGLDTSAGDKLAISPDAVIMDEAFRALYGDSHLDFRHLEKYDIDGLTKKLATSLNARLGDGTVKDVLIQDFSYMPKNEAPR
jgi:flagellar basal body-associated protein FliL